MDDEALRRFVRGQPIPDRLFRAMGRRPRADLPLTRRELEVVRCFSHGMTVQIAATALGLAYDTVKCHAESAQAKMKTKTKTHTVAQALRLGLID